MSQRLLRLATRAALLALVGLAAGCGSNGGAERIVAEAGDIRITLAQFHEAYNLITPDTRPDISTREGRRSFANNLLNKEIILAEAHRMGIDPGIEEAANQTQFQKMLETLYRTEISEKVEVLGEDMNEVYEKRKFNVKGSHILVEDLAAAERILGEIRSGKITFERAAASHSLDRATLEKGGAMSELRWSMALPDFQQELFAMQPGEVKAYGGAIGGHVLRLDERIPREQGSLEEVRQTLRSDVRQQLETVRLHEYMKELETKAGLTWQDRGLGLCVELMRRNATVDTSSVEAKDRNIPVATDEERTVVIASFSGRNWTVADYIEGLRKMPPKQRPPGVLPERGLRELIRDSQLRDELLRAEAFAKGLDKEPTIQQVRARQMDELLVDQVVFRYLQAAEVPEERARAVYDSALATSPEALLVPEQVDCMLLVHTDSAVVAQGLARIRAGEDESTVIKELSVDFRSAVKGGRTGLIPRGTYAPELEEAAFAAEPGSKWSKPVVTPTGTGAFRVIEHQEPRSATFEEVKDQLTTTLARNEGERAFEAWLEAERQRLGVKIYDEVLEMTEPEP